LERGITSEERHPVEQTGFAGPGEAADLARATAEAVLAGRGWIGAAVHDPGGAYVFSFHPFAGGERTQELDGALVCVTPLDHDHVRVQLGGVTISARAVVRRKKVP
jgi:hypothetical protein